eukprot:scaffold91772_cov29-Phaeocystis_antarctica.AAC.1
MHGWDPPSMSRAPGPIAESSSFKLQAAVHAFRGVPQGLAAGAWDAHAALMDRSRDRFSLTQPRPLRLRRAHEISRLNPSQLV